MRLYFLKYICLIFIVAGLSISCTNEKMGKKKPNILFILIDDLGKEWLSCYGAEDVKTPNIDELASSEVGGSGGIKIINGDVLKVLPKITRKRTMDF